MSVAVQCASCGQQFAAAPHLYGTQLACPNCGASIQVPPGPAATLHVSIPQTPPTPTPVHATSSAHPPRSLNTLSLSQRRSNRGGPTPLLIAGFAGVGLLIVLSMGVVSWLVFSSGRWGNVADQRLENKPLELADPVFEVRSTSDGATTPNLASGFGATSQNATSRPSDRIENGTGGELAGNTPDGATQVESAPIEIEPEDPEVSASRIRKCWSTYMAAIRNHDDKTALSCIDHATIQWYEVGRQRAIAAKRTELTRVPPADKIMVLTLRHQISLKRLQGMTGEDIFRYTVANASVGRTSGNPRIADVTVVGDTAQCMAIAASGRGGASISFNREDGNWKVNLVSMMAAANQMIRLGSLLGNKREDDLILESVEQESGTELAANIWEPLDPKASLRDFDKKNREYAVKHAPKHVPKPARRAAPEVEVVPESRKFDEVEVISSIANRGADIYMFAPTPHPFLLLRSSVWDLRTGKKVSQSVLPFDFRRLTSDEIALSPSGKILAKALIYGNFGNDDPPTIEIFDVQTGQRVNQFTHRPQPSRANRPALRLKEMRLVDDNLLFTAWPGEVEFWDLEKNTTISRFEVEVENDGCYCLNANGDYLAIGGERALLIFDVRKGRTVASMEPPKSWRGAAAFNVIWGVAFSPDTQEIAALIDLPAKLIVWSSKGKIVLEYELPARRRINSYRPYANLTWLPDQSGWWIDDSHLLLREPLGIVWEFRSQERQNGPRQLLGNSHVAVERRVTGGTKETEIVAIKIPWERIRQTDAGNLPLVTDFSKPSPSSRLTNFPDR